MAEVIITGTARYPEDNAPIVSKKIGFQAQQSFVAGGVLYVPRLLKVLTDATGAFADDGQVTLVVPDDSSEAVAYTVSLPNGSTLSVPLDSSMGTLTMADLWALDGAAYVEPSAISGKADVATTLAGYGITDAATAAALTAETTTRTNADAVLQTAIDGKAAPGDISAAVATHEADTTNVHGIADTSALVLDSDSRLAAATPATNGLMSATDKTKLNGIAAGATVNSSDATLLDRTNHTGTQTSATISDFSSTVQTVGNARYVRYDTAQILSTGQQQQVRGNVGSAAQVAHARVVLLGQTYYSIPGVEAVLVTTLAVAANQVRYAGMLVAAPITIDQLACEVTTAAAASSMARLGIYAADTAWMPTTLIVDAGTVAVDTTGVKTAMVNVTLQPGRYLTTFNTNGTPTMRSVRGGASLTGYAYTLGAAPVIFQLSAVQTFAAFPATPTQPDTLGGAGSGMGHVMWLRISSS